MGVPVLWQDGPVVQFSHFLVSNVQSKLYRLLVFFFNQMSNKKDCCVPCDIENREGYVSPLFFSARAGWGGRGDNNTETRKLKSLKNQNQILEWNSMQMVSISMPIKNIAGSFVKYALRLLLLLKLMLKLDIVISVF